MNNKLQNQIFFSIFFLLVFGSIGISYNIFFINKDYQVIAEVSCDSYMEECLEYNDGNESYYYKFISKNAREIEKCLNSDGKNGCKGELSCTEGEINCEYFLE